MVINETKKWPQYMAGLLACVPMYCLGCALSWTSPALDYLQQPDKQPTATKEEATWIASILGIGAVIGTIPASYLSNLFGRKISLLLFSVFSLIGWITIVAADRHVTSLLFGRFICGIAAGSAMVIIPFYNEEISEVGIRGTLGYFTDFMITVGCLCTYTLEQFLPYFWLSVACIIPCVVFLMTFAWMPESPLFLVSKSRINDAVESLRFLRGPKLHHSHTEEEIIRITEHLREDKYMEIDSNEQFMKLSLLKKCSYYMLHQSNTCKSMRIILVLIILSKSAGVEAVAFFSIEIFRRGHSSVDPHLCNAVIGISQFIISMASAFSIDKIGRRRSLYISSSGMVLSTAVLLTHFALLNINGYSVSFGWVPCFSVSLFISSYAAGMAPGPWLLMAELVPTESKSWVGIVSVSLSWIFQFIICQAFSSMLYSFHESLTFSILCFVCILCVAFTILFIPETKHKTRTEIQRHLSGKCETLIT